MKLKLPCRKQIKKNHEARFIERLIDEIEKKTIKKYIYI